MSKNIGKAEVAPDVLELEPEEAGEGSHDGSGDTRPPRVARGSGGSEGGGRRGRGAPTRPGPFERMGQFLRDTRSEMRRVSWPALATVQNTTLITLVAVIFFAVYLFAVDHVWAFLLTQLDQLLNKVTGAA